MSMISFKLSLLWTIIYPWFFFCSLPSGSELPLCLSGTIRYPSFEGLLGILCCWLTFWSDCNRVRQQYFSLGYSSNRNQSRHLYTYKVQIMH